MANMSKSKQLLVRTALVTASTVATLVGAQTLALTDLHPVVAVGQSSNTAQTVETSLITTSIAHAAPSIVVIAGNNQQTTNAGSAPSALIAPPVAQIDQSLSQFSQSSPITVQQFPIYTSRSSR